MHRTAWIITLLLIVPSVSAGDWEKLSTDLELFDQVISVDQEQMQIQQEDAALEDSADLFPAIEGEEDEVAIETDAEEEFATIIVDDVPILLTDVPLDEWFAEFVEEAAALNLISGYRDDSFNERNSTESLFKKSHNKSSYGTNGCDFTFPSPIKYFKLSCCFMSIATPPYFSIYCTAIDFEVFAKPSAIAIIFSNNFTCVFRQDYMSWVTNG